MAVFGCAWHYRQLVARLTVREIEARFRGSLLGKVWAGIVPLFMLGLSTFVFGVLLSLPSALITKARVPILVIDAVGGLLVGLIFPYVVR